MRPMTRFALPSPSRMSPRVPLLFGAGYLLLFVALDRISYIRPLEGLNITPWSPQTALAIALLMWNRRLLWLVCVGLFAADLAVRGAPANWLATAAAVVALGLICSALACSCIGSTARSRSRARKTCSG